MTSDYQMGYNEGYKAALIKMGRIGRPKGAPNNGYKLDIYKERILEWYKKGMSFSFMAERCDCSIQTISNYLKRIGVKQC